MNQDEIDALVDLAEEHLNFQMDWFDYANWDGLIECDEEMTVEELEYLRDNFDVEVKLVPKAEGHSL